MTLIPKFIRNTVEILNNLTHTGVTASEGLDKLTSQVVEISEDYLSNVREDIRKDLEVTKL